MTLLPWLLMCVAAVGLHAALRRDRAGGLALALALWVLLPRALRIPFDGPWPDLTAHRLMLGVLLLHWWRWRAPSGALRRAPYLGAALLWWIVQVASALAGDSPGEGMKANLSLLLDQILFLAIVGTSLFDAQDVVRGLRGIACGLVLVAGLAVIERYTGFNPVDRYLTGAEREPDVAGQVLATYPHRILLGTAMAMGWPLCLALHVRARRNGGSGAAELAGTVAILPGCYFGFSRGPWLAALLGALLVLALGSRALRLRLVLLGLLMAVALAGYPNTRRYLASLAQATVDVDSFKGGTFQYRMELWRIAASEVARSPRTLLLGYGPRAAQGRELDWVLAYRGRDVAITSWDNQYAYMLYSTGALGLALGLALYGRVLVRMARAAASAREEVRDLQACGLASAAALLFMMSNVLVFAPQLNFLFWFVAVASAVLHAGVAQPAPRAAAALVPRRMLAGPGVVLWPPVGRVDPISTPLCPM